MADQAGTLRRVSGRPSFRTANRIAQTLLLVGFGMSAAAVADGTGTVAPIFSAAVFSNDLEGSLVRAMAGLRHLVKGDMLMAQAGKPVAFASTSATADSVAPLQDEARVRLQRYLDAP